MVRVGRREDGPPGGRPVGGAAPAQGARAGEGHAGRGGATMNNEILDALSQITREKSVDRQLLVETLEAGLASAVRKKHGATADVEVKFSNDTGQIAVALRKTVVEIVDDAAFQMTIEEARKISSKAE